MGELQRGVGTLTIDGITVTDIINDGAAFSGRQRCCPLEKAELIAITPNNLSQEAHHRA